MTANKTEEKNAIIITTRLNVNKIKFIIGLIKFSKYVAMRFTLWIMYYYSFLLHVYAYKAQVCMTHMNYSKLLMYITVYYLLYQSIYTCFLL